MRQTALLIMLGALCAGIPERMHAKANGQKAAGSVAVNDSIDKEDAATGTDSAAAMDDSRNAEQERTGEDLAGVTSSSYADNLDSLMNLWYVRNTPGIFHEFDSIRADTESLTESLPDSVYIERLARLSSPVPLTFNKYVRNYINMYTHRRKDLVGVMLGLSDYYFPIFEEIFDRYDIPLELKYCSIIESALNPRAVSRVGATGIWQFMYGTGRMYDLTINSFVDERRDPIKSTYAAARFMKDLYDIYGDWILVIAAYNCGPGSVNRAIRRSGGKKDFWDIYYYLPRQTRGHVPAFIAAAYIMNYYRDYNLVPVRIDLPIPSDTVMVDRELHLGQVSGVLGIPIDLLRDMNPQYKHDIIPGQSRPFPLRLPVEYTMRFIDNQDSILAYRDSVFFNKDAIARSPADFVRSSYLPEPPSANMTKVAYTVKSGDNLGFIATWYHVRVSDLKYWNNIHGSMIRSGQQLIVYVPKSRAAEYRKIDGMSYAEKQRSVGKAVTPSDGVATPSDEVAPGDNRELTDEYIYYTVRSGDTLWDIAQKFSGVTDTDIMELNDISNASKIRPGQVIKIKKKG